MFNGISRSPASVNNGGIFFPQAKALGIDVDETLSPELLEQVTFLGTVLSSFPQAARSTRKVLGVRLGRKLIERVTERIGAERVAVRDADVDNHELRTLVVVAAGPVDVTPPTVAAVMADGGMFQRTAQNTDSSSHWSEYKAGLCLSLAGQTGETPLGEDPHPRVPEFLLSASYLKTLTREIAQKAADVPVETAAEVDSAGPRPEPSEAKASEAPVSEPAARQPPVLSPQVLSREVVATTRAAKSFGEMLRVQAWQAGMFQSSRKAFVGDGSGWIWTIWETHFKAWGFVPVLDLIHAVTHVYAAAMAGRTQAAGWAVYAQWIGWLWSGEVSQIITALRERAESLGEPTETDGPTSVRSIVWSNLTYLENQQSRMDYARYRREALPITSSHMESTVKELNYRIKGSEKFWSNTGGESVLQLKADELSTSNPLDSFWSLRSKTRTGLRARCQKPVTP